MKRPTVREMAASAARDRRGKIVARLDERERRAYRLFYAGKSIGEIAVALCGSADTTAIALADAWIDSFREGAPTL